MFTRIHYENFRDLRTATVPSSTGLQSLAEHTYYAMVTEVKVSFFGTRRERYVRIFRPWDSAIWRELETGKWLLKLDDIEAAYKARKAAPSSLAETP